MRARVLGIRLLTLDGTITLTPAEVQRAGAAIPGVNGPRRRFGAVDRELDDAVRGMDEGAALLARLRREPRAPQVG